MSNVKAYRSETASQRTPSQNFPSRCTLGCLVTKRSFFLSWLVAAMFLYTLLKCSGFIDWMVLRALKTHQMDKKENTFMRLVGFECPLRDEKKLLLEKI